MKREDLTKEEQVLVDYGYVCGEHAGYINGARDYCEHAENAEKQAFKEGVCDGTILAAAGIALIAGVMEWATDNDVSNRVKTWTKDKWNKLKEKIHCKK